MKKVISIGFLITIFITHISTAQPIEKVNTIEECDCIEPNDFLYLCSYTKAKTRAIEPSDYTFRFEQLIIKMSCVNLKADSPETIIRKVNCMWNKYKTQMKCDGLGFHVPNGNLLKHAINWNFPDFVYYMADFYNADLLFTDPADNRSLLGYLNDELEKTHKYGELKLEEIKEVRDFILKPKKYNPASHQFEVVK